MDNVIRELKSGDSLYIKAIYLGSNKPGKELVEEMSELNPSKQFFVNDISSEGVDLQHNDNIFKLKYVHFLRIDCAIATGGEVKHDMTVFSPMWFQTMNKAKTIKSMLKTTLLMAVSLAIFFNVWANQFLLLLSMLVIGFRAGMVHCRNKYELVGQIELFLIDKWKEHWFMRKL